MKIVIAVDMDKQTIAKRTGQAAFFAIYEDGNIVKFVANRHGQGEAHHQHTHKHMGSEEHTNEHARDVRGLQGCDIILVQAVGENMREALESIGLKVKKIRKKDGLTADEVVKNFLAGNIKN